MKGIDRTHGSGVSNGKFILKTKLLHYSYILPLRQEKPSITKVGNYNGVGLGNFSTDILFNAGRQRHNLPRMAIDSLFPMIPAFLNQLVPNHPALDRRFRPKIPYFKDIRNGKFLVYPQPD